MAPTDQLAIERIGQEALPEAVGLTAQAHWNQTADDWGFFFAHGTVFGARDANGRLVATTALLPYSAGFAWISLVIVAKSHRGRGLGTRMLNECLAELRSRALVGMLDATPAGARVYAPLGFKPIMALKRWEGMGGNPAAHPRVRPLVCSGIPKVARFDAAAFGASREALLGELCARTGTHGLELEGRSGYALVRSGRVASHAGPVVAEDERDAVALIETAIGSALGSIFIDVPDGWADIAARLGAHGFRVQRTFLRMALGRDMPYGDPPQIFAIAGPEYG
jgi:GNAT superfamily N-acetyltransferase